MAIQQMYFSNDFSHTVYTVPICDSPLRIATHIEKIRCYTFANKQITKTTKIRKIEWLA